MAEYDTQRRATAVPALKPITKNEAAEGSDLRRTQAWERAREAIADDIRKQSGKAGRKFADLVKKK
jgi:hypothetical protein